MAKLHSGCFLIATLLFSFSLPSLQHFTSSRPSLSLLLHLQPPSSYTNFTHNATLNDIVQQPLTPYFFGDEPLSRFDERSQAYAQVGSAHGLYLADPAASMELRYLFCTVIMRHEGDASADKEAQGGGSLMLMGSLDAGAIAVIGGTGSFAFASGQAKVSMASAGSKSEQLSVYLNVELQADEVALSTI